MYKIRFILVSHKFEGNEILLKTTIRTIMPTSFKYGNLDKAYQQVSTNKGSSGVDGMEVEDLRQWLGLHLKELQESSNFFVASALPRGQVGML
jgi:retron-type reverse transcriptase